MISAFGPYAERYARGLGELDAVITEPEHVVRAYIEALRRRERGQAFYGMLLVDDPRVSFAYGAALSIVNQFSDVDMRERAFAMLSKGTVQIDGRPASAVWSDIPPYLQATIEFYRLCSTMLVRSYAEFSAFTQRAGGFARPVERVLSESRLPHFTAIVPERPTVVVWAPHRPGSLVALHLSALAEFPGDVFCVTANAPSVPFGAQFASQNDPQIGEILARAGCVVCVEPNDPADAVAFARRGTGIVAPLTSGAHEFVPNAVVWDAADSTTLYKAVARALSRPAIGIHEPVALPRVPVAPPAPLPKAALPLVSVVIPTFNRPSDLHAALTSVREQTYPNVEAVVVNDYGTPVDDIVAEFPFARLVEHSTNRGAVAGLQTGMRNARGDYIQFLPDDDLIYPDHIERVMYALLRTGAKIAHGNGMLRYVERGADGGWVTTGLNASLCSDTLTPITALIATPVSENAVIQHRSVYDEAGWWLMDSSLADLELHMRLAKRFVFVHADDVTFEFREHANNQAKLLDFATELRRIYEDLHPAPGRPILAADRETTHATMRARIPGQPAFPPTIRLA